MADAQRELRVDYLGVGSFPFLNESINRNRGHMGVCPPNDEVRINFYALDPKIPAVYSLGYIYAHRPDAAK